MYNYNFRRQFDNVKRVFKAVEELQGSVIQNISSMFLLSEDLSKYVKMKKILQLKFLLLKILFLIMLYV